MAGLCYRKITIIQTPIFAIQSVYACRLTFWIYLWNPQNFRNSWRRPPWCGQKRVSHVQSRDVPLRIMYLQELDSTGHTFSNFTKPRIRCTVYPCPGLRCTTRFFKLHPLKGHVKENIRGYLTLYTESLWTAHVL